MLNSLKTGLNRLKKRVAFGSLAFSVLLAQNPADVMVDQSKLGFQIPTFSNILTSLIRLFFVIAGIAALFMLLTGALAWITSGGSKENVEKARDKITHALVGVILIVIVLSVVWSLEQLVFKQAVCFGISCPVTIPGLLEPI